MPGGGGEDQDRGQSQRSSDMWHAEGRADRIQFLPVILRLGEMFGYG